MADGEGLVSRCSACLTARTANVDFGRRPSPLRGRPSVGLCRFAALFIPRRGFRLPAAGGGWGGIGLAVLDLSNGSNPRVQIPAVKWRMGRDCLRCAPAVCLKAISGLWPSVRFARLELRMLISAVGLHPFGADLRSVCAASRRSSSLVEVSGCLRQVADGEGLVSRCSTCLTARTRGFKSPQLSGGWGGIRTLGALLHTRFPSVRNRPLCHPS